MKTAEGLRAKIRRLPVGTPFLIKNLYRTEASPTIRKHLSDMVKNGVLERLAQGIYVRHGERGNVDPGDVARAVARAGKHSLLLAGRKRDETIYFTTGPDRKILIQGHRIVMRHLNPSKLAGLAGFISK